jgi:hypothetical protein
VRLPSGYLCETEDGLRILYEDAPVYRPIAKKGDTPVLESERRKVASFGKGSRVRDIEKVARLDSKSKESSGVERQVALLDLRNIFRASGGAA